MVKQRTLLLLASIVWLVAGGNILKIGIELYLDNFSVLNLILSLIVFLIFWLLIFSRLVKKHTKRILGYKEKKLFINFFDVPAFIIMAFMMTLGIIIRVYSLLPNYVIAFFYSGLGTALFLAGISFFVNYIRYEHLIKKENNDASNS